MFTNLKPTFGTPSSNTSFGFSGGVSSNPFGQTTFGKPATTGFAGSSSTFGSTPAPLFGTTTQHGSLFGTATPTASFGQPAATQPAFGSMFGSTQAQPSTGLFGSPNTSTFGQQNKPATFGFGTTAGTTSFFGQQTSQPNQQASTGLFGQNTNNLFGQTGGFGSSNTNTPTGTVVKFNLVTGTDTMVKGNINQTVSTRHHCITCMKEYEGKSLEELRWEDYQANRKGPQQGTQPSGGLFGGMTQPVGTGLFGSGPAATSSNSLFGQAENKSVFGSSAPTGGFGQPNAGFGTASTSSSGLFGKPLGFGTNTSTTSAFAFNSGGQTSLFGGNTPNKPFGTTTQPNALFGQQSSGFGTQSSFGTFGGPATQNVGLFSQNKPATPFNMGTQAGTGFGTFGQPATQNTGSLFPGVKTSTAFGGFGAPASSAPVFGQSSFGQTNQSLFSTSFNKPATNLFGQPTANTGLGTGLSMGTGSSLFGNTAAKPGSLFGTNTGMFNSGFGVTPFNTSFNLGSGTISQPGGINTDLNQSGAEQQIMSMTASPFGLSSHLNNITEVQHNLKDLTRPTNPSELNALLNSVNKSPNNSPTDKLKPIQIFGKKVPMFDGLEAKDDALISNFRINNNPKRLMLRKQQETNRDEEFSDNGSTWSLNSPFAREYTNDTKSEAQRTFSTDFNIIPTPLMDVQSNTTLSDYLTEYSDASEKQEEEYDHFTEASDVQEWQAVTSSFAHSDEGTIQYKIQSPNSVSRRGKNKKDGRDSPILIEVHKTGIILTRSEYYTKPSLDELIKYISDDGTCIVEGFTIGRIGYGNVRFSEAFDVSNLDLDELVHFRNREINIYPDESKKPPVGQGLNRKAQVTLDNVWPYDKQTQSFIMDPELISKRQYADRLRRVCEKQGTRFLEYRPDTGSWVFKVDHFSKYGILDSEDSDEDVTSALKDKQSDSTLKVIQEKGKQTSQERRADVAQVSSELFIGLSESSNLGMTVTGATSSSSSSTDVVYSNIEHFNSLDNLLDNKMDSSSQKYTVMKSAFFLRDSEDYADTASVSDMTSSDVGVFEISAYIDKDSPMPPHLDSDSEDKLSQQESLLCLGTLEEDDNIEYVDHGPDHSTLLYFNGTVPLSQSHIDNRIIADIAAFKGRSFKVGWSKTNSLFCLSTQNVSESTNKTLYDVLSGRPHEDYSPFVLQHIQIDKIQIEEKNPELCPSIEQHMYAQMANSEYSVVNNMPHFNPKPGYCLLEAHCKIMSEIDMEMYKSAKYYSEVWNLCVALWGQIDQLDLHIYDEVTIRKIRMSNWLKSVVSESVNNSLNLIDSKNAKVSFANMISYISGYDLVKAARCAIEHKSIRLAMFISQIPASDILKEYMKIHLENWLKINMIDRIDENILKIYMLSAGIPIMTYKNKNINVCENMEWIRAFAMYFWYIAPATCPTSEVVDLYEQAFDAYVCAARPSPPYNSSNDALFDLNFHLLKFFSDDKYSMKILLDPLTHTDDHLDYMLSWLLLQTFTSLNIGIISKEIKRYVTINFAAQLERIDLWHWAIFVLLTLDEPSVKYQHVIDIIGRNVKVITEVTEEYKWRENMLVNELHIPSEWFDDAKANRALVQNKFKEATYYLYFSKRFNETHEIIIKHFVPEHFLCYDYDYLVSLLQPLSEKKEQLHNWDATGGLILDFAKLGMTYNNIMEGAVSESENVTKLLTDFKSVAYSISSRFRHFPRLTYLHSITVAEISARIATMMLHLLKLFDSSDPNHFVRAVKNCTMLPLPADYLQRELVAIVDEYLNSFKPEKIFVPNKKRIS